MRTNHHLLYFIGLATCAVSLPLSPFLLSVSQFFLAGNWIIEGQFKHKWQLLKQRKGLLIFFAIFLLHFVGLFYSQNITSALNDLKIKLPLFILPLILATSRPVGERETNRLLLLFALAALASSILSFVHILSNPWADIREASLFISYIRLSIQINLSIFFVAYLLIRYAGFTVMIYKIAGIIMVLWFGYFLFLLKSLTGFAIFLFLVILLCIHILISQKHWLLRFGFLFILSLLTGYVLLNLVTIANLFLVPEPNLEQLKEYTESGNPYKHEPNNLELEGGNYVWLFICEEELEQEWNKVSELDFQGKDLKGQELRVTLIRYMTSLGLRKDSAGFSQLTERDLAHVEHGIASAFYTKPFFPNPRLYQFAWEMDRYFKGGNPNNLSVAQRIEYWKTSLQIIRENPWFGTGTGDVQIAFDQQYEINQSELHRENRLRAHNQFLTFAIALGIPAMILLVIAIVIPLYIERKHKWFLAQVILFAALISMMNEDTLETQAGVSFFAYFYSLLVFGSDKDSQLL